GEGATREVVRPGRGAERAAADVEVEATDRAAGLRSESDAAVGLVKWEIARWPEADVQRRRERAATDEQLTGSTGISKVHAAADPGCADELLEAAAAAGDEDVASDRQRRGVVHGIVPEREVRIA